MPATQHNNSRQSPEYYSQILRILVNCNINRMAYAPMAAVLNDLRLTTPTGLKWHEGHIRQLLKKLKNYKTYPSFIGQHLMQEVFEGSISAQEAALLFKSRKPVAAQ